MSELLPCPFCASPAEMITTGYAKYFVTCTGESCHYDSNQNWFTEKAAAEAWNRRVQPAQVDQMIDPNEPADYHRGWKDGYKHGAWAAQPAPGAWQPIETAPKPSIGADGFGVRILLAVDCGEGTVASVKKGYWEGADWYLDDTLGLATSSGYRATHWQPLPAPPVAAHSAGNAQTGEGESK